MEWNIEAAKLDTASLPSGLTDLSIHTIRKSNFRRLEGLGSLPITALGLRWLSAQDLTAVPLPKGLKSLTLWQSPKIRTLAGIEQAPALETLHFEDNGILEDGSALGALPHLKALTIEGGMNAKQKLRSLDFLDGLNLNWIRLSGIEGADLSLAALTRMPNLTHIDIHARSFAPAEIARVAAAHPGFHEELLKLPDYPPFLGMRCKSCGGVQKEMFLRRVKFLWCPVCETEGIARQLKKFERMVDTTRASL